MKKNILIFILIFYSAQSMEEESTITINKTTRAIIQHYLDHPRSIDPTLEQLDEETKEKIAEIALDCTYISILIRLDCDKIRRAINEKRVSEVSLYHPTDEYRDAVARHLVHYRSSNNDFYNDSPHIRRLLRSWGIICGKRMPREFEPELIRLIAIRSSGKVSSLPKALSAPTLERITRCENLTELNLSKFSLSSVPVEFLHLPHLRTLNLSKNGLTELPEDLSPLKSLEHLYCTDNNLTELPASLFALTNLKKLNVSSNQLATLSPDIGKLENLEQLSVEANTLPKIPTQIGLLTQLTKLVIGSNKLTYLPTELAFLCNLKELWSDHNELKKLPPILSCTQLRLLWLCKNKIKKLPEDCSSLITLERINLENNRLTTLPATLKELPKLNVLLLDKNHFDSKTTKQIKEDFEHLKALSI